LHGRHSAFDLFLHSIGETTSSLTHAGRAETNERAKKVRLAVNTRERRQRKTIFVALLVMLSFWAGMAITQNIDTALHWVAVALRIGGAVLVLFLLLRDIWEEDA
jgi:hypothetical protein